MLSTSGFMNGNAKGTAFLPLLLALALPLSPSAQARGAPAAGPQDPDGAVFRSLSAELAHYVKNEWCGLDRPAMAVRWAEFYYELERLFILPTTTKEDVHGFFRRSLGPGVVRNNPGFFRNFGERLDALRELQEEVLQSVADAMLVETDILEEYILAMAGTWAPNHATFESYRRRIFFVAEFAAEFGAQMTRDEPVKEEFHRNFPKPEGMSAVCGESLSKAIDGVPPLRLGGAALFVATSIMLSP